MPTYGVDFFRIDRSGPTKRLLVVATSMVTLGATSMGAHLVHRLAERVAHTISLVGGVTTLAGLVLGFGAMAMLLFENVYLLIKEDGVLLHDNGKESTIAWSVLESVDVDAGFVVLERKDAEPIRWFAGAGAQTIRDRVDDARRKALHGLLKSPS